MFLSPKTIDIGLAETECHNWNATVYTYYTTEYSKY